MDVLVLSDAVAFAAMAGDWLAADPFSTNVVGVHLDSVLHGRRPIDPSEIWVAIRDGDRLVGAGMHSPTQRLVLPRMATGVATEMAVTLHKAGRAVRGVTGVTEAACEFVETWAELRGAEPVLARSLRFYRLGQLTAPDGVGGHGVLASSQDKPLLVDWFVQFQLEAAEGAVADDLAVVERSIGTRQVWLWYHDGEPVSMAGLSRPWAGVARIGPVYTPPRHRRHGYGSAVTAQASMAALAAGAAHVALYADLANPTSNSIYQTMGYVADHDAQEWDFVLRSPRY